MFKAILLSIGAFLVIPSTSPLTNKLPTIDVISSDPHGDMFWKPQIRESFPAKQHRFVHEAIAVYGMYSPYHFTHWMYNGIVPLFR
jgi:hypothetical protein